MAMAVLLSACMTRPAPQKAWYKPGATQQTFNVDSSQCRIGALSIQPEVRVQVPAYGPGQAGAIVTNAGRDLQDASNLAAYMSNCMVAKGWSQR